MTDALVQDIRFAARAMSRHRRFAAAIIVTLALAIGAATVMFGVVDAALLAPLIESLNSALEALREITRGVYPAQLARSGLPTALGSLLARPGSAGQLVVEKPAIGQRFEPRVEAAVYFCVAEAARELEPPVLVRLTAHDQQLQVVVTGRDRGGLPLGHMRDRIEAAGGSMSVTAGGQQTVVEVRG
jgi:signal transduction histidine kinase